jgi:nucleotide-binding universal stress UspA family protein
MKKMLVPIDGSDASKKAAARAIEFAKQYGSEITFLTVAKAPDLSQYGMADATDFNEIVRGVGSTSVKSAELQDNTEFHFEKAELFHGMKGKQEQMLDDFLAKMDTSGVTFNKIVLEGEPSVEILKFAEKEKFDLILMGRRGFSKLRRLFIGSVTQRVIADAPCPVYIMHEEDTV